MVILQPRSNQYQEVIPGILKRFYFSREIPSKFLFILTQLSLMHLEFLYN